MHVLGQDGPDFQSAKSSMLSVQRTRRDTRFLQEAIAD
jgi:hypothetical protein